MANDLTGDYDVVAEFTIPAVNRILAAMHRGNRFPHALSVRVDETPKFADTYAGIRLIVDGHGEAITDHVRVTRAAFGPPPPAGSAGWEMIKRNIDPPVNPPPMSTRGFTSSGSGFDALAQPHINAIAGGAVYNYLHGVAQLQLGPPTMELPADRTTQATVRTPVMIRYFSDAGTMPLTEFLRGDILTTMAIKPSAPSAAGTFVTVDLAGSAGNIRFNRKWSANSLTPAELATIDRAVRKSALSSFQPSSTPLPSHVKAMNFKGFPASGAVAVMMNVSSDNQPSPASVEDVFVGGNDHFALAMNGDLITAPFAAAVNSAVSHQPQKTTTKIKIDYWLGTKTFYIHTTVTVLNATVTLVDNPALNFAWVPGTGQIVLTIPVQVRFGWENKPTILPDPVDFDFTIVQVFTLALDNSVVSLQPLGDVAINIPSFVPPEEANPARTKARDLFKKALYDDTGQIKAPIQAQIGNALSVSGLQDFLKGLMNPAGAKKTSSSAVAAIGVLQTITGGSGTAAPSQTETVQVNPQLSYTSFEIRPAGIILHGSLAVPPWPAPHLEYDLSPWTTVATDPDYSALRSWIPGGTISDYTWTFDGKIRPADPNRFASINAPGFKASGSSVCLSYNGKRLSASGPVVYEDVAANRRCRWTSIPLTLGPGVNYEAGNRPRVVVPKLPPRGELEVAGHTSPWAPAGLSGGGTANYVIHFPDDRSVANLEFLTQALEQSRRTATATAILCVLEPHQVAAARPLPGLMFADDANAWERMFSIRNRPATVLLDTAGRERWRHEGELSISVLAETLVRHLAEGGEFFPQFLDSPLRIGEPGPNFFFDAAPGEPITLRKMVDRPVILLFWKNSSRPAMDTLASLRRVLMPEGVMDGVILIIDDGESDELAIAIATGGESGVIVVPDPDGMISNAYGIRVWPTTVFMDAAGLVREIQYGVIQEEFPATETKMPGQSRPESSKSE